ncbi:MAG TPA: hypothetical protein VFQ53_41065 [Kofleriaceae bacterium]|nr:hypothetical protein [Kofleriaceae bacterium]
MEYIEDDPHHQESLLRRYGWSALLYVTFAALLVGLFLMML